MAKFLVTVYFIGALTTFAHSVNVPLRCYPTDKAISGGILVSMFWPLYISDFMYKQINGIEYECVYPIYKERGNV